MQISWDRYFEDFHLIGSHCYILNMYCRRTISVIAIIEKYAILNTSNFVLIQNDTEFINFLRHFFYFYLKVASDICVVPVNYGLNIN